MWSSREVRCINPDCGALNRVPRYSIRCIPRCGSCHTPLSETATVISLRRLYRGRSALIAVPCIAFVAWIAWGSAATDPGKGVTDPTHIQAAVADACTGHAQPRQGIYRWGGFMWGDDIAVFTITTAPGSNYFVKLEDQYKRAARTFFVNGGSALTHQVPLGSFTLKYASGKSWCNENELFGPDTTTKQADEILTCERRVSEDAYGVTTYTSNITVELILQRGGNLRTHAIPRSQF
jgi:hypothetical protein